MRYPLLAVAAAALVAGLSSVPARALGPAHVVLAPDAPVTQVSAARNRRILMMRTLQMQQQQQRRGHGGFGGPGMGRGGYQAPVKPRGPYGKHW